MPVHPGTPSPIRGRKFAPSVLEAHEIAALMGACDIRTAEGLRDRALIVTLYRCGIRISEALSLVPSDISRAGAVTVRRGKFGKRRVVGIDMKALEILAQWAGYKARCGMPAGQPLFTVGQSMRPLIRQQVARKVRQLAARAGVQRRVHCHGLRHTLASELAMEGVPLVAIQGQLGHTSLATTQVYIQRIAPAALLKTMTARSW